MYVCMYIYISVCVIYLNIYTQTCVCTNATKSSHPCLPGSFVVRFSRFHTTRNHIQGVGRARASEAKVARTNFDARSGVVGSRLTV